jgi:hypothetical protein
LGIQSIWSVWSVWSNQSIRSVPSNEDPILDLPLPWRERIEVRGSFVYLVYLVFLVMSKGFGFRVQGVTSTKMVIARAKPVAIYDFPLLLILKPESENPNLRRRLPHLLIPYTLIFLSPRGRGPR